MRRGVLTVVAIPAVVVPATLAAASVPPGGDGVSIVRQQAETAAAEYFARAVDGGATHVVCETPSADAAGVVFYCFGVNGAGAPVVAQATINDLGSAEVAAVGSNPTATATATSTTVNPVVASSEGTGSQTVQVDPIIGPTIVAVAHDGAGAFAVQPLQGGVPAGTPFASVTGAWSGRYLVGLGGTISAFDVTAEGAWTLTVQQRSSALTVDGTSGVSGENADVIAYANAAPWTATVTYDGAGPIAVNAVTVSGSQELVNEAGAFSGQIEIPAGPGFVTIDAPGRWSLGPDVSTTSTETTLVPATTA